MVPHAGKDFKQQGGLTPEALELKRGGVTKLIFTFANMRQMRGVTFTSRSS